MPTNDDAVMSTTTAKRSQWKEKLFSRDKSKGTSDQQIHDFLHSTPPALPPLLPSSTLLPSTSSDDQLPAPTLPNLAPVPPPPTTTGHPPFGVPIPPSRRRSPTLQQSSIPRSSPSFKDLPPPRACNTSSSSSASLATGGGGAYLKSAFKSRCPKWGIKVTFSSLEPELIGEGGDDADLPTIEISSPSRGAAYYHGSSSYDDDDYYYQDENDGGDAPSLPQLMASTSLTPEEEPATSSAPAGRSRLSFRASSEFAQQVRARMQAEEGRVLHESQLPPGGDNDENNDAAGSMSLSTSPSSLAYAKLMGQQQLPDNAPPPATKDNTGGGGRFRSQSREQNIIMPTRATGMFPTRPQSREEDLVSTGSSPPAMAVDVTGYQAFRPRSRNCGDSIETTRKAAMDASFRPENMGPYRSLSPSPMRDPVQLPRPVQLQPPTREVQPREVQPQTRDPFQLPHLQLQPQTRIRDPSPSQPAHDAAKPSIRSVATHYGESAFDELTDYVSNYMDLFAVKAEESRPLLETPLSEWIRASTWWFLCGRKRLEAYARTTRLSSPSRCPLESASQAVLDLGKSLWICTEIVPRHHELQRYGDNMMSLDALFAVSSTTGDTQLSEALGQRQTIMKHLHSLSISIKRNNIIASISSSSSSSVNSVDTTVWVRYPFFAPDVAAVLSGLTSRSMLLSTDKTTPGCRMPVGDTADFFSYGTLFVDVSVSSRDDEEDDMLQQQEGFLLPCVLSIIRGRTSWCVSAAITSQNELVNVVVQSDRKLGPTWQDVLFDVGSQSIQVRLPRGFALDATFREEEDFKILWNIVHYTQKTEASLHPKGPGEVAIFTHTLKTAQYIDPAGPVKAFPSEPTEECKLAIFERTVALSANTGTRSAHRGFRIVVVTNPGVKTLSHFQHVLGQDAPVVFGLLRGKDHVPALMLKITEEGRTRSVVLGFYDVDDRWTVQSILLGIAMDRGEVKSASELSIRSYSIDDVVSSSGDGGRPSSSLLKFPPGHVSVIDEDQPSPSHVYGPTILSEHLRIFVASEFGSVTDRVNLGVFLLLFCLSSLFVLTPLTRYIGPGELKVGLDVDNKTGLTLYRPAQEDMTVSVAANLVKGELLPGRLAELVQKVKVMPLVRSFDFSSMEGR